MCQIVSLIASRGNTGTDAMTEDLVSRVKMMELQSSWQAPANIDILAKTPPPRLMKTHLPIEILELGVRASKARFVVVMRNPKDCVVSYHHFYRAMAALGNFTGSWNDFFELFKAKGLINGDWLDYNLGWWSERRRDNVLIVKYEDLKLKPRESILNVASFCGVSLCETALNKVLAASSFDSMKSDPLVNMSKMPKSVYDNSVSPFMRKGIVGDWKSVFSAEQNAYVDESYTTEAAKRGLHFDFGM